MLSLCAMPHLDHRLVEDRPNLAGRRLLLQSRRLYRRSRRKSRADSHSSFGGARRSPPLYARLPRVLPRVPFSPVLSHSHISLFSNVSPAQVFCYSRPNESMLYPACVIDKATGCVFVPTPDIIDALSSKPRSGSPNASALTKATAGLTKVPRVIFQTCEGGGLTPGRSGYKG
ncbi:hypothetical protein BD311DRAFT_758669 [Dichomitus squalens]|uniref:Uncharacterized protein n=1 Tax=Dichomitus squalens TaxID=114155 RepID=A0A4Q9MMW4_9APHY|nr:hypothetical protein BD311DRAFT_758669 [Dichomitus squalens]